MVPAPPSDTQEALAARETGPSRMRHVSNRNYGKSAAAEAQFWGLKPSYAQLR